MELKGIKLTIDMDTTKFTEALNKVKSSTNGLNEDLKKLKQSLKFDPKDIQTYSVYVDKLKEKIAKVEDVYYQLEEEFNKGLAWGEIEYGTKQWIEADNVLKQLKGQLSSLNTELENAQKSFSETGDEVEDTSESFEDLGNKTLGVGDIIDANLISSTIMSGLKSVLNSLKEIGEAYLDLIKNGIEYNAQMQSFSVSLHAIGEANGETTKSVDDLINSMKQLGAKSSFSTDTLLEVSQQLMASGINAEEAGKSINDLSKILAYAGKGDDELKRMGQNLNQIKNAGKATAQDLKQFAYAGVPVYKLLADYSDEFNTITKETVVTYEDLVNAFGVASEEGSQYFNAIDVQASTFNGQMSILQNNWDILTGLIAEDATNALSQNFLPAVNKALTSMQEGFGQNGMKGLIEAAKTSLDEVSTTLGEIFPELSPLITAIKEDVIIIADTIQKLIESEEFQDIKDMTLDISTDVAETLGDIIEIFDYINIFEPIINKLRTELYTIELIVQTVHDLIYAINAITKGEFDWNNPFGKDIPEGGLAPRTIQQGWGGSGGFGALHSGGYGNTITLNASFNVSGELSNERANQIADILTSRINENLGKEL